jgi:hypothetical protein
MADTHINTIKTATVDYTLKFLEIQEAIQAAKGGPDFKTIEAAKQNELREAHALWKKTVAVARAKLHGRVK